MSGVAGEPGGAGGEAGGEGREPGRAGGEPGGAGAVSRELAVRWRDLDPLGHVYHAVVLSYLEEARNAWLEAAFDGAIAVDEYVVARLEVDYRAEVPGGTAQVVASCRAEALGRSSVTTAEELRAHDGTVLASARVVLVVWDRSRRASRPLTAGERASAEAFGARPPRLSAPGAAEPAS